MIPSKRKRIYKNVLELYRNNLLHNPNMDAIKTQQYINAITAIKERQEREEPARVLDLNEGVINNNQLSLF